MPRIQMTNLMCLDEKVGGDWVVGWREGGVRITITAVNFVSATMGAITGDSYLLPLHS